MERGLAIPVAIVDPRARVEQQDCRVVTVVKSGNLQWRQALGWVTQVAVGAAFQQPTHGRRPALSRCITQARLSTGWAIRCILDAHTTTSVVCHANKRVEVAARRVIVDNLVDERAFLRADHRVDPGCRP